MKEIEAILRDNRITTAEILYHMPDHPTVLQSFVWQFLDIAPRFPKLRSFLDFWTREIDGRIHSVTVANSTLPAPARWRHLDGVWRLQ
ncbi:aspartate-semialdehyde dehydrogenase [Tistrella mobilis]